MRRTPFAATSLAVLVLASSAACSGGGQVAGTSGNRGTFVFGVLTDPGSLDPQRSEQQASTQVAALAYDSAVTLTKSRQVEPGIVTSWKSVDPTTWDLTVRPGVTCSDGGTMDAKTVAANFNYVADAKNASPFGGTTVPVGSTATASGDTVTVKVPTPTPFLIPDLGELPLVCAKGLTDRSLLATKSDGTGPYTVTSVTPGSDITYSLRKDYTKGLSGTSTSSSMPATIVVKTVSDATTMANLLLNGQVNGAIVTGADQKRLNAAGLFSTGVNILTDQIYFNHGASAPTSDADVRKALVKGLNMPQVIAADTGGLGTTAQGLLGTPKVCGGDTITGNLPSFDETGARALLAQAGWTPGAGGVLTKAGKPLTITLAYSSDVATASNAAQVVASEWTQLGVKVTLSGKPSNQLGQGVFAATLNWDAILFDLGFATPAQMTPFMSGTVVPKGENFSGIDNADYNSLIAKASTQPGTAGCADWNAAEAALFRNADVAPTGQAPFQYYGKNATFEVSGYSEILPTSIAMK